MRRCYPRRRRSEKQILEGLASKDEFEQAHRLLGETIGFQAGKVEAEGSPDPWWIAGDVCSVFEDNAGAGEDSIIDVTKARQVSSHPKWMRANVEASSRAKILPVLVTPAQRVKSAAVPHLNGVGLWPVGDMRKWAGHALAAIREFRKTFVEQGDLEWRAKAAEVFEQNGLSARQLLLELESRLASKHLEQVG